MKNYKITFVLMFLSIIIISAFMQNAWQNYDFKQASFRIAFPNEPTAEIDDNSLQVKTIHNATLYRVAATWGGSYDLNIADDLLKETENFINKETDFIESTRKITIQNAPAKEIRFRTNKGKAIIFRTMITSTQTFQFIIMKNGQYASEEDTNRFFNSFTLLK